MKKNTLIKTVLTRLGRRKDGEVCVGQLYSPSMSLNDLFYTWKIMLSYRCIDTDINHYYRVAKTHRMP